MLLTALAPLVRRVLGEQLTGVLDYVRYAGHPADGPFNSQPVRQQIFLALMARIKPAAIVETGTFRGTTTQFMAGIGVPVFTIEASARAFGYARARLWTRRNITMLLGDSRRILENLFAGALREHRDRTVFFYLDAHWSADLPLAEEVAIVFRRCARAVVMIDDFRVPHDDGYGYDAYGPGGVLETEYIQDIVDTLGLSVFYPSTPSDREGGSRRGSVVLALADANIAALSSLTLLQEA